MPVNEDKEQVQWERVVVFLFLFYIPFMVACGPGKEKKGGKYEDLPVSAYLDMNAFANELEPLLKVEDTGKKKRRKDISNYMADAYHANDMKPFWVTEDGVSKQAKTLIDELEDMLNDGLDPERYKISALKKGYATLSSSKTPKVSDVVAFDTTMTNSYLSASRDLLTGAIPPKQADSLWFHGNDTVWRAPEMLKALGEEEKYTTLDSFRSRVPTYAVLREEYKRYLALEKDSSFRKAQGDVKEKGKAGDSTANALIQYLVKAEMPWVTTTSGDTLTETQQCLRAYQWYSGLRMTNKADSTTLRYLSTPIEQTANKLKINMERVRWMHREIGDFYVLVDVAMMELFFRKEGADVMHMRVVVGRPERQTPSLNATMANVVVNPPWGVPPTIMKKDVLPGMTKSAGYLKKKGLKAYDRQGNIVDPGTINANNYKRFQFKQAPGDDNALGYVKFNFPNPWDIYMHDTPHREDFPMRYRAKSSGCVRVEKPKEMAVFILNELEKKRFPAERLDSMIKTHKTSWQILKNKIPVHLVYLTAMEDSTGKHLRLTGDIYKRDNKLEALLK